MTQEENSILILDENKKPREGRKFQGDPETNIVYIQLNFKARIPTELFSFYCVFYAMVPYATVWSTVSLSHLLIGLTYGKDGKKPN